MNSLSAIYAIAAAGMIGVPEMPRRRDAAGDPSTWRRRCGARRAGALRDPCMGYPEDECRQFVGKALRHRFNGQVRDVFNVDDRGVAWGQRTRGDRGKGLPITSHRKALQWLRNADVHEASIEEARP